MNRIGLDLDEVLVHTIESFLDFNGGGLDGYPCQVSDFTEYRFYGYKWLPITKERNLELIDLFFASPQAHQIKIIEGVYETLDTIQQQGNEIHIITARDPKDKAASLKLFEHHGIDKFITDIHLTGSFRDHTQKKSDIAKFLGIQKFVDDSFEHCLDVAIQCGIPVYMPTKPRNSYIDKKMLHPNIVRIDNISQILD